MGSTSMAKILVIGATGYIGRHLIQASIKLGHPTFALVRPITASHNTEKINLIQSFKNNGVNVLFRYFPSEFGFDVDRVQVLEPAKSVLAMKVKIREAIRKEGIPFTFVSCNFCFTYFLSRLGQVEETTIPNDRIFILGDGNTKVVFVDEHDISTYAIKVAKDERTLNKVLYIRPPANIYSHNELISLWEKKKNITLERIYVAEEEVLKKINESPKPLPFFYAIAHAGFIKGETTNFDIDPTVGVEASQLYPDVKYTTVENFMDQFL
ncbi:hypothetical protein IEQ34_001754 [Dendrobium chrysotoxum]|uniref:NmrA-like domain-containing protein n=1 Tax=Dendrobium chrysotoxum TaxID=161865 RepID=A0AAV7HNK3_DENCH|nr:hypothetical protein IEQ34_001754 [Dendrobium chrysotoxum]